MVAAWHALWAQTVPVSADGRVAARLSVDSTFPGYRPNVLVDGRWIAPGQETQTGWSHPDRLGNGGNTWVSAEGPQEHWIRLDWSEPIELNQVTIVWSRPEWHPRAFRIEHLVDQRWEPVDRGVAAWEPTNRQSVIVTPLVKVQSLRVVQPAGCSGSRGLMAAQEVAVGRGDSGQSSRGVRAIVDAELQRLSAPVLVPNIARLSEQSPGASSPVAHTLDGATVSSSAIADGDASTAAALPENAVAVGVEWPIRHVVDKATFALAAPFDAPDSLILESHDGERWVTVSDGLTRQSSPDGRGMVWSFEPIATRALRVRTNGERLSCPIAEFEVHRYLPPDKSTWPERLVQHGGLQRTLLDGTGDPSFEKLAQYSLPMTPVRALVGLKDDQQETGVAWDGTILGREAIRFVLGEARYRLADGRETLHRTLLDGWLPAVQIDAQFPGLRVRQTVFTVPVDDHRLPAAVVVRLHVENLTDAPCHFPLQAEVRGDASGRPRATRAVAVPRRGRRARGTGAASGQGRRR